MNLLKVSGTESPVKKVAVSEKGVIDLASIMVGLIVIGLMGAIVAATVFTVIPWAQEQSGQESSVSSEASSDIDSNAFEALTAVVKAQDTYLGLSKTSGDGDGEFGSLNADRKIVVDDLVVFDGSDYDSSLRVVSTGEGAEARFAASVLGSDGTYYAVTDKVATRAVEAATAEKVRTGDTSSDTLANIQSVDEALK